MCPHCGSQNIGKGVCMTCGGLVATPFGGSTVGLSGVISFDQVQAADVEQLKIGGVWDQAFGGGIPPGATILFTGRAGSGKSTILQQNIAKYAAVTGKKAFLFSAEQSAAEIKVSLERLAIPNPEMILGLKNLGRGAEFGEELFRQHQPCVLLVDSLTALCGKDRDKTVVMGQRFKELGVKYKCIVFMIAHMTKSGDMAGFETLIHDADALAMLDNPEEGGPRKDPSRYFQGNFKKLIVLKCRFGATDVPYWYEMTDKGLHEVPPDPDKDKRERQELGQERVHDTSTLAGIALTIHQLEDELRETQADLREQIKSWKTKQIAMAAAEPEKPRAPKKPRLRFEALAPDSAPRSPPKKRAGIDKIIMPDGQQLVRKPRKDAAESAKDKSVKKRSSR